ncbi:hypothetical protein U3516DRAFT_895030 [Neocallimastix sp. 'constans']
MYIFFLFILKFIFFYIYIYFIFLILYAIFFFASTIYYSNGISFMALMSNSFFFYVHFTFNNELKICMIFSFFLFLNTFLLNTKSIYYHLY